MSKKFWKAQIDDVANTGCTAQEVEALLDAFCYAMKSTACTLTRRAEFKLADFATVKKTGLRNFSLTLAKTDDDRVEQWTGVFEADGKTLKVLGMLENE